jgi:ATP-dependent Clp endopeptidase proteolytic subunit ClpP
MDIYVNGTIVDSDDAWIYDLFGIENVSPTKIKDALKEADGNDVDIFINSGGGSVFAGSEIYSMIQRYKGNVTIHVTGLAASAASVIACAGKCLMAPTAQMMVHNVSSYGSGDYKNFDKMSEILKKANEAIAAAYVQKSGMSMQDALELMDVETWLTAKDALEYGLIDGIEENQNANKQAESNDLTPSLAASTATMLPREVLNKFNTEKNNVKAEIEMLRLKGESNDN